MSEPELPYDLPEAWTARAAFPFWAVALGALAAYYLVRALISPAHPLEWFFAGSLAALCLGAVNLWRARSLATGGIRLMGTADFTLGEPQPEETVHVWDYRPYPWLPLMTVGVIFGVEAVLAGLFLSLGVFDSSSREDVSVLIGLLATVVLGAFYFLVVGSWGIRNEEKRGALGQRERVLMSTYGISYRIQGLNYDLPWDEITGVNARMYSEDPKKPEKPYLWFDSHMGYSGFAIEEIGASPAQVLAFSRYYWMNPDERAELGTPAAQERMDAWLASRRPTKSLFRR